MAREKRVYEDFNLEFTLSGFDRRFLRETVVSKFLSEEGGYWKEDIKYVTRYKYYVEKLEDGRRIFLLRPTFLNKGIDFQVWVEKLRDEEDRKPSHKDVFADLILKKKENPSMYPKLLEAIDRVWNCEEPDVVLKDYEFTFIEGFSVELLLKILKWLFIEQDITYWNYDGRGMLRQAIESDV
jgi:hypothetical protein